MPTILVTDTAGAERPIEARSGRSLMENIRDAGFEDLLALCGGCCACATCHVHVDPEFAALLPAMDEEEDALLDGAEGRTASSRLSCQIRVSDALQGLRVTIAPSM